MTPDKEMTAASVKKANRAKSLPPMRWRALRCYIAASLAITE
jgi:hypothetical protein